MKTMTLLGVVFRIMILLKSINYDSFNSHYLHSNYNGLNCYYLHSKYDDSNVIICTMH